MRDTNPHIVGIPKCYSKGCCLAGMAHNTDSSTKDFHKPQLGEILKTHERKAEGEADIFNTETAARFHFVRDVYFESQLKDTKLDFMLNCVGSVFEWLPIKRGGRKLAFP